MRTQASPRIFFWSLIIFALDQATKQLIVNFVPLNGPPLWSWGNDLLNIIHIRNENIAFSLGRSLPPTAKFILFIIVAGLILLFLALTLLFDRQLSLSQRRLFAVILGGGAGNLFDRIFRKGGVVDFIDVDIPDINFHLGPVNLQMSRWPVFNVADSSIVIAMTVLLLLLLFNRKTSTRGSQKHS